MGSFLHSVHLASDDHLAVRQAIEALSSSAGAKVWLAPAREGWISFFPEDLASVTALAHQLSLQLALPVLVTLVHDSDAFCYLVFEEGKLTEEFVSNPEHLGDAASGVVPVPERIAIFLRDAASLTALRGLLALEPPDLAEEQMAEFFKLLGIRNGLSSYDYIERGERDNLSGWSEFVHLPDRAAEKARRKLEKQQRIARKKALRETGVLLYDSELLPKRQGFHRWIVPMLGSPPGSAEFFVTGYNEALELMRWLPPAEPVTFGVEGSPQPNTSLCFLPRGRLLLAIEDDVAIVDCATGKTLQRLAQVRGNPIAHDPKTDIAYLDGHGTLLGVRLADDEIVVSVPFQKHARMIRLHPTQPHLIWTTQHTLGITDAATGEQLLELQVYNERLIPKKKAQWLEATGRVPSEHPDVLERESFLSMELDRSGERLFAGTTEGLREYRYADILSAKDRMPLPIAGFEVSEKLQDYRWVHSVVLDERRARAVFTSGDDSIRYYDWGAQTTGLLKASSETKRIWKLTLSGDASRLFCHLGAGGEDWIKRQDDHWVQVWDYEQLCASLQPVTV